MNSRARVIFEGLVQGVFFRANTQRKAKELKVCGWVRNLDNGSVEALFEGRKEDIEKIIEWCRSSIPMAEVTNVKISWDVYKNEFKDFFVRR
ncbi:MAG: acylphosphatase [Candidatus Thermoplasmatota archaeon]